MREFWFSSEQTKLFAVEDGAGRPVVMLHGGLADHTAAWGLVAPLAARFHIVAPDLRASGKSWDARPLSWSRLADDLVALLDRLEAPRAVVGGVSGGTGVALRFALRRPERVAGLVLAMPVYAGAQRGLTEVQRMAFGLADALGRRAPAEGVGVLRPLYGNLPPEMREQALAMLDGFDAGSIAATTAFLAAGAQPFDDFAELRALAVPTLLQPGGDDLHPAAVAALYAEAIPGCRTLAPGADFAAALADFCDHDAQW